MKIKTPFFIIEFEIMFLIVFFSFILSNEIKKILFSFYMCYLFIIFHELSHMFVATILGKEIKLFKFSLAGVNICFSNLNKFSIYKEILIYLAGPVSNIVLATLFQYNKMIFEINLSLTIINLIPIFPLDGYNILYNILRNLNNNIILEIISGICILILSLFSIIQIIYTKNISILIFLIYIFVIYLNNKKGKKWSKYTY